MIIGTAPIDVDCNRDLTIDASRDRNRDLAIEICEIAIVILREASIAIEIGEIAITISIAISPRKCDLF